MATDPSIPLGSEEGKGAEGKRRFSPAMIVALLLGVAILTVLLVVTWRQQDSSAAPPVQEDLAYASRLELSDFHLSAAENFLGQNVVYLDGKITNQGPKRVHQVRVRLYFRDYLNQVVFREELSIPGTRAAPLAPGETREFQLAFDNLPPSWNIRVPEVEFVSAQVE